jgi:DNA-binding MarR family transcriptional regulator
MSEEPWWTNIVLPALLRHARTTYGNAMRAALAEADCDDVPRNGLFVIGAMAGGETPLADVIRAMGVSKQTAGQLVDTLVLRGYLERAVDPNDRRRLTVKLTERGEAAAAAQAVARQRIDDELTARIGAEKVLHGREMLGTLIAMGREAEGE